MLPGFRKGRAPRRLLEKRFGKETTEQIKLKLLAEASECALKDNKLDALRDPDIDYEKIELPESGPLKFDFEIEVRPEFELPALEGIAVNKTKLEVTEGQIDREIEQLQRWSGIWAPAGRRRSKHDDQIIADVTLKPKAKTSRTNWTISKFLSARTVLSGRFRLKNSMSFLPAQKQARQSRLLLKFRRHISAKNIAAKKSILKLPSRI